ncbi:hypothetical protein [Gracilibacillus alcaliphilus]|uniref:hypothetical protein n=1 Tax=Gracilibacillus alcaliphilus TaxID=1401441 RepID=UPI00195634DB|nr:hypothetical protein [Gracilibacillus alcaliphilus]MBM7678957.1 hypothetical protein [Gracilibacillus alcaliphilus]
MIVIKEKLLTGLSLIVAVCFTAFIWGLTIQSVGIDSVNKATIIGGILSMFGGMVGAFSAYFISRFQLTKQMDLQDQKDRSRVLLETELRKAEEILGILNKTKMSYFHLSGIWSSVLADHVRHIRSHYEEKIDYDDFVNTDLLNALDQSRDEFIMTYMEVYKYSPYYAELISRFKNEHNMYFKKLTVDINAVVMLFKGVDSEFETYRPLLFYAEIKSNEIDSNFSKIQDIIDMQIADTEKEISELIQNFKKHK